MAVIVTPDDPRDLTYDRQVARQFARLPQGWWRGATARRAWFLTIALATLRHRQHRRSTSRSTSGTASSSTRSSAATPRRSASAVARLRRARRRDRRHRRAHRRSRARRCRCAGANGSCTASPASGSTRQRYYRLDLAQIEPANPEYRIADESRLSTEPVVDFAIDLLNALLSFVAFIGILWTVGGAISFQVLRDLDHDPGLHDDRGAPLRRRRCRRSPSMSGARSCPASRPRTRPRRASASS